MSVVDALNSEVQRIRNLLAVRPRQVESGCVVKMPFSVLFSGTALANQDRYLYGVVGPKIDYYQSTTASVFHVYFTLDGLALCNELSPLLDHHLFDNDMIVVRFPDQNASLDDPNLDRLFRKENGKWYSRHGYHKSN
jgi:hypothetical protein